MRVPVNRWEDQDSAAKTRKAQLRHRARPLADDTSIANPGGGNFSVKGEIVDHLRRYVVLTNVDGGYEPVDGLADQRRLIDSITAEELAEMGATSVDQCLAPFLRVVRIPTWIIDGLFPQCLAELLGGSEPLGTPIDVRAER